MHIHFAKCDIPKDTTIILALDETKKFLGKLEELDKKSKGALSKAVEIQGFKAKKGEIVSIIAPANLEVNRIIIVGLGKAKDFTPLYLQEIGGKLYSSLKNQKISDVSVIIDGDKADKLSIIEQNTNLAYGIKLKSYCFDKYKTEEKQEDKPQLNNVYLLLDKHVEAEAEYLRLKSIANGVFLARDVVSEPPNVLYPESYAARCKGLERLGVNVKILGEKEMTQLGMGALLGVGQGSIRDSQLVIMEWKGDPENNDAPIAFVGKGVTFDTGGISLKPAAGMEDMKYDMGGSAAVVGLMKALAGRKAKVNAVGVIGLAENMPGHNAQRPGDVVTSMAGKTIAVLNTDAEGRLVLADALWYTQDTYRPKFMINLATLTGAIVVALGDQYAGIFSNNDKISTQLSKVGEMTGEKVWRFPMSEEYNKTIDSDIADMQNMGSGRGAGSIVAAQFLERFVNKVPWVHIDIAGMAWVKSEKDACPKGAVGFGVKLLDKLVEEYYESK